LQDACPPQRALWYNNLTALIKRSRAMGSHGGKPHIPLLILEMGLQKKTVRMAGWRWGSKLALIIASLLLLHFSLASG